MTSPVEPHEFGEEGRAATHGQVQAAEAASGQRLREPLTVTAVFDDRTAVDRAVEALYSAGTPRDLVEVVVSRAAAERFYADAAQGIRRPGRETFRYAGIGGLFGFIAGVFIGLVMVALPGIEGPGGMALVQVFGPNMATIGGAAIGAVIGFFRRQRPNPRHARAAEASGSIVLAVATRSRGEAQVLGDIIGAHGGHDVRVEEQVMP
jgi:hypothetical protein